MLLRLCCGARCVVFIPAIVGKFVVKLIALFLDNFDVFVRARVRDAVEKRGVAQRRERIHPAERVLVAGVVIGERERDGSSVCAQCRSARLRYQMPTRIFVSGL